MKYLLLFLFIVYLPLIGMYIYQRSNKKFEDFKWGTKNRIGVWLAIVLALIVVSAKHVFPSFVQAINVGWDSYRGTNGEFAYCFSWLVALILLIFPHMVKRDNWPSNPSPMEYHDRYKCDCYWYGGLIFSIIPIHNTLILLN
ncbi:hypothetical protein [Vibrio atypicus]|uniref:hypothetical protein n=1 Tax=Vibrio atypicus TaxID=558271 RepID=UPI003734D6BF